MTTTRQYGSWVTVARSNYLSTEDEVHAALEGAIKEWPEDFTPEIIDAIASDYRDAIANVLPEGISLCGDEFIANIDFESAIDPETGRDEVTEAIDAIDFWAIAERHDGAAQR